MNRYLVLSVLCIGVAMSQVSNTKTPELQTGTFAGGCFWCMEPPFEKLPGVHSVQAGYMGGNKLNPTYQDYAQKGFVEVVQIQYDPSVISYNKLLDVFWRNINPTDPDGQFNDRGPQYRTAIFYHTRKQQDEAAASKKDLNKSGRFSKPIVTEILSADTFYPAEDYHQDYAQKNPIRYKVYRYWSGRDAFIEKHWGTASHSKNNNSEFTKPSDAQLRKMLTPLQYQVTQQDGTEPPFNNEYNDNKRPGIYVDIVSGEPLFSSLDKYDSSTGWPSFMRPLEPDNIVEREDRGWLGTRTEIRSKKADSHLGHVFKDGPPPTGLRYCMNSAALKFIPEYELNAKGYGKYKQLFEPKARL